MYIAALGLPPASNKCCISFTEVISAVAFPLFWGRLGKPSSVKPRPGCHQGLGFETKRISKMPPTPKYKPLKKSAAKKGGGKKGESRPQKDRQEQPRPVHLADSDQVKVQSMFHSNLDALKAAEKADWGRGPLSRPDAVKARTSEAARDTIRMVEAHYGGDSDQYNWCRHRYLQLVHQESELDPSDDLQNDNRPSRDRQAKHKATNDAVRLRGKVAAAEALGLPPPEAAQASASSADDRSRHGSSWAWGGQEWDQGTSSWSRSDWTSWSDQKKRKHQSGTWDEHVSPRPSPVWNKGADIEEVMAGTAKGNDKKTQPATATPSVASPPGRQTAKDKALARKEKVQKAKQQPPALSSHSSIDETPVSALRSRGSAVNRSASGSLHLAKSKGPRRELPDHWPESRAHSMPRPGEKPAGVTREFPPHLAGQPAAFGTARPTAAKGKARPSSGGAMARSRPQPPKTGPPPAPSKKQEVASSSGSAHVQVSERCFLSTRKGVPEPKGFWQTTGKDGSESADSVPPLQDRRVRRLAGHADEVSDSSGKSRSRSARGADQQVSGPVKVEKSPVPAEQGADTAPEVGVEGSASANPAQASTLSASDAGSQATDAAQADQPVTTRPRASKVAGALRKQEAAAQQALRIMQEQVRLITSAAEAAEATERQTEVDEERASRDDEIPPHDNADFTHDQDDDDEDHRGDDPGHGSGGTRVSITPVKQEQGTPHQTSESSVPAAAEQVPPAPAAESPSQTYTYTYSYSSSESETAGDAAAGPAAAKAGSLDGDNVATEVGQVYVYPPGATVLPEAETPQRDDPEGVPPPAPSVEVASPDERAKEHAAVLAEVEEHAGPGEATPEAAVAPEAPETEVPPTPGSIVTLPFREGRGPVQSESVVTAGDLWAQYVVVIFVCMLVTEYLLKVYKLKGRNVPGYLLTFGPGPDWVDSVTGAVPPSRRRVTLRPASDDVPEEDMPFPWSQENRDVEGYDFEWTYPPVRDWMGLFQFFASGIYVYLGPETTVPFFVLAARVNFDPRSEDLNRWVQCTHYYWVYDYLLEWYQDSDETWPFDTGGTWGEWMGHFRAMQASLAGTDVGPGGSSSSTNVTESIIAGQRAREKAHEDISRDDSVRPSGCPEMHRRTHRRTHRMCFDALNLMVDGRKIRRARAEVEARNWHRFMLVKYPRNQAQLEYLLACFIMHAYHTGTLTRYLNDVLTLGPEIWHPSAEGPRCDSIVIPAHELPLVINDVGDGARGEPQLVLEHRHVVIDPVSGETARLVGAVDAMRQELDIIQRPNAVDSTPTVDEQGSSADLSGVAAPINRARPLGLTGRDLFFSGRPDLTQAGIERACAWLAQNAPEAHVAVLAAPEIPECGDLIESVVFYLESCDSTPAEEGFASVDEYNSHLIETHQDLMNDCESVACQMVSTGQSDARPLWADLHAEEESQRNELTDQQIQSEAPPEGENEIPKNPWRGMSGAPEEPEHEDGGDEQIVRFLPECPVKRPMPEPKTGHIPKSTTVFKPVGCYPIRPIAPKAKGPGVPPKTLSSGARRPPAPPIPETAYIGRCLLEISDLPGLREVV